MVSHPAEMGRSFSKYSMELAWQAYLRCLSWGRLSMWRRHLLWQGLEALKVDRSDKVLIVGWGSAIFRSFLSEKVPAADYVDLGDLGETPANIDQMSAESVDKVFCSANVPSPVNRLVLANQIRRVLKPNGALMLLAEPAGLRRIRFGLEGHFKRVRNIWGFRRRARALAATPKLGAVYFLEAILGGRVHRPDIDLDRLIARNGFSVARRSRDEGAEIFLAIPRSERDTGSVWASFRGYSRKYKLRQPLLDHDSQVISVTGTDLERNHALTESFWRTYVDVFGSARMWSEGAYCDREAGRLITIGEYRERAQRDDLTCECGGHFQLCYPYKYFRSSLLDYLGDPGRRESFCSLLTDGKEISGFIWGSVEPLRSIMSKMSLSPPWVDARKWALQLRSVEKSLETRFDVRGADPILFIADLGIATHRRRGMDPLMLLLRQAFSFAGMRECQQALCWTSPDTPVFKFARYAGFEKVGRARGGVVFMYSPDIVPALRILQHSPRAMLPIMIRNAKLVGDSIGA